MEIVYKGCCSGVDMHKNMMVACINDGGKQQMYSCATTTRGLTSFVEKLQELKCQMVAMESTASYWKPLFNILEQYQIPAMVVNANHMKQIPGRKTDKKDAEWITDLLRHGLLKASFIPEKQQRELREALTYRASLVDERKRVLNRLQKILEGCNVKLSGTVSDIMGKSGRRLLEALMAGEVLNETSINEMIAKKEIASNLKATAMQLADDMEGNISDIQRMMLQGMFVHYDFLSEQISNFENNIEKILTDETTEAVNLLTEIPGISTVSAQVIISVIGHNMEQFPSAKHLCSWAGICPGNNESAGKRKSGRINKGNKLLKTTLINCANAAVKRKDSYFYARYQKLSIRMNKKRAIVAVAHSMLTAIYNMLKTKTPYKDLGVDYFTKYNAEKKAKSFVKKLKELGYDVNINKKSE